MSKPNNCRKEQDWNIGIITKECPVLSLEELNIMFKLWGDYHKHRIYPQPGGYLFQSVKILRAFTIIDSEFAESQDRGE